MNVDWDLVARFGVPVATSVLAAIAHRVFEHRPRLVAYYSSLSAFVLPPPQPPAGAQAPMEQPAPPQLPAAPGTPAGPAPRQYLNAHTIVIRNAGKRTAFNVRVGHLASPLTFELNPPVTYEVVRNENVGWEIRIPTLVPAEQVQVSYLYLPPMTVNLVNSYVKSDEMSARVINVLPTPQPSTLARSVGYFLFYLGLAALTYLVILASRWVYAVSQLVPR